MRNKFFLIIVLLLGLVVNALTATGKIQYSGMLSDASGKPVNGIKTTVFTLYDAIVGGSILWQSGEEKIIVKKGEFSYVIGEKPALPGEIFDGRDVYLEIRIEGDILEPREELLKVPFAAYAAAAGSAKNWKASTDGVYYDSGHVGIGTDNIDMPLRVVGSYPNKHSAGFEGLSGHGVAIGGYGYTLEGRIQGYVKDAMGNDNPSNIRINVNGGNVGIGNVTTDEKLVVDGKVKAAAFVGDGSGLANVAVIETDPYFSSSSARGITNAGSGKVITDAERVKLANAITTENDTTVLASVKDGVDWTEIQNMPEGFSDGVDDDTDTKLTEAEVDAMVSDNGYVTSFSETDPTVPNTIKDGITWDEVSNRPIGLDDGDDNTQLTEAQVDTYVGNNGYLTSYTETDPRFENHVSSQITNSGSTEIIRSTERAKINEIAGKIDGFSGDAADLNYAEDLKATGVTATEFDYLDGVTSNIQKQFESKISTYNVVIGNKMGINAETGTSTLTVGGMIESTNGGYKFPDGSIQTTATTGGGVNGMGAYKISIGGQTATSTYSWTNLHNITLTTKGYPVLCLFNSGTVYRNAEPGEDAHFRLLINGVQKSKNMVGCAKSWRTSQSTIVHIEKLSAGTYTFTIQWRTGTVQQRIECAVQGTRHFIVMEQPNIELQ